MRLAHGEIRQLSLAAVADACRQETGKFLRRAASDEAYCWELFRRAVCERQDGAWAAAIGQYRGMVLAWVRQHPLARTVQEDDEYWINRAFERFWHAVGPDRFGQFVGLSPLLKYLKLCVHSVLIDEARARAATGGDPIDDLADGFGQQRDAEQRAPDVEALAVGQLSGGDLWRVINAELADDAERLVVYLSFVRDLKPREIYEQHRERLSGVSGVASVASVADVYRIKRNVIARLRRSPEIRTYLS